MVLEFESQVPDISDYSSLLALCVDKFSEIVDRKFKDTIVSIAIVDEDTIKYLNYKYRGKDNVTDVLSFNLLEDYSSPEMILGEIFICYKKALEKSKELGHNIDYEIAILCIHGLYHLIGYDHKNDDDYEVMKVKEKELLMLIKKNYSFS